MENAIKVLEREHDKITKKVESTTKTLASLKDDQYRLEVALKALRKNGEQLSVGRSADKDILEFIQNQYQTTKHIEKHLIDLGHMLSTHSLRTTLGRMKTSGYIRSSKSKGFIITAQGRGELHPL